MSQKAAKMCKSPKNILLADKVIEYEHLNTNCTIVGSNNLHLVRKPLVTSVSPAYAASTPSPGGYKSPSPQAQAMKPPTPQPTYPVMQIINPSSIITGGRHLHQPVSIAAAAAAAGNVIKLKPPLNILPKPAGQHQQHLHHHHHLNLNHHQQQQHQQQAVSVAAVARQSPRPTPAASPASAAATHIQHIHQQQQQQPQATLLQQQPLLLNQMPMLAAAQGVRFILQPQTAKIAPQVQQVQQVQQTPQGLILQSAAGAQSLLQLQPPRSQPMVRVLTNGVGLPATTYVTQMAPVQNIQTSLPSPAAVAPSPKRRPAKKKKQKLDLANIMKLSGIGDDDDVLFESDASQSEGDASTSTLATPSRTSTPHAHHEKKPIPPTAAVVPPQQQQQQQHQMMIPQQLQQQLQQVAHAQQQSAHAQPMVQVLNHQPQQVAQPMQTQFGGFSLAPNFTIGANGLMAVPTQRSNGGFKLALGEDGRLVLQHDPTLNQDLNAQLLLQSIFGLNGGCGSLVLQPSMDQQIHSQTVQTIQQQSVQTIQQQTVQSQTIQTVQHQIVQPQALQSIQSQLQGQIQSLLQQQQQQQQQQQNIMQQPTMQGLITSQAQAQHAQAQQQVHSTQTSSAHAHTQLMRKPMLSGSNHSSSRNPSPAATQTPPTPTFSAHAHTNQFFSSSLPTSLATTTTQAPQVLKVQPFQKSQPPVQTVHPIHHQAHAHAPTAQAPQQSAAHAQATPLGGQPPAPTSYVVNLTPDQLEQLKRNGQLTVNGQTIFMQRPAKEISEKKTSPKIKPMKKAAPVSKITTKEPAHAQAQVQQSAAQAQTQQQHPPAQAHAQTQAVAGNHVVKPNTNGNNLDKIINSVAGAGGGGGGGACAAGAVQSFTPTAATGLDTATAPSVAQQITTPAVGQQQTATSVAQPLTTAPSVVQQLTTAPPIVHQITAPSVGQQLTTATSVGQQQATAPSSVHHQQQPTPGLVHGKVKTAAIIQPSIVLQSQQQQQQQQVQLQHLQHVQQGQVQQIQQVQHIQQVVQSPSVPQLTTQTKLVTAVAPAATPMVTPTATKVMITPRCAPSVSIGGSVITSTPSGMVVTPISHTAHAPAAVHHIVVSSAGGGMSLISAVPVPANTTLTMMTASPSMVTSVVPSGLPSVIPSMISNIQQQQVVVGASMPGLTPVAGGKVETNAQAHPDVERYISLMEDGAANGTTQVMQVKLPTSQQLQIQPIQTQQIQTQPQQLKLQKLHVQPIQMHMNMQMIGGQLQVSQQQPQQDGDQTGSRPQTPCVISQSPAPLPQSQPQSMQQIAAHAQAQQIVAHAQTQQITAPAQTQQHIVARAPTPHAQTQPHIKLQQIAPLTTAPPTVAQPPPPTATSTPKSAAPAVLLTSQSLPTAAQQAPMIVSSPLVLPNIPPNNQGQRIHTIQLTPQKQQHLKSIQLQIQTLSTRMQPGNAEMQKALNVLFQEQQKILASGKLLPPDKVFYHGNQIIVNNASMVKNDVLSPPLKAATLAPPSDVKPVLIQPKIEPSSSQFQPTPPTSTAPATVTSTAPSTAAQTAHAQAQLAAAHAQSQAQAQANANKVALYKRAQLIEQQMNTDQNGAIKPDIHTPFRDKADACKRLIRYHCFEQPVLSEKDLSKADEIFELTARHFIGKFGRMVDKYRFLLHKESQRHVQTSELMMLDRMFLSEEQQSLIKLRQEIDELQSMQQQELAAAAAGQPEMSAEDYDEWACIQRELGCLPEGAEPPTAGSSSISRRSDAFGASTTTSTSAGTTTHATHPTTATKRPLASQESTNKKQRTEKSKPQNGLQSGEATRFVLKSSSLTNLNVNTSLTALNVNTNLNGNVNLSEACASEVRHNLTSCATSCATMVNFSATQTNAMQQANNYIQQQRFNLQQQQFLNATHAHAQYQHNLQSYNCSMTSMSSSGSSASTRSNNEENDSIDEQVQSAIDSILNLQQGNLELDETMQNMLS